MSRILIEGREGWLACTFTLDCDPASPMTWRAVVRTGLTAGDMPKVVIDVPFGYLAGAAVVTEASFMYGVRESVVRGDRGLTHYAEAGEAMEALGFSG